MVNDQLLHIVPKFHSAKDSLITCDVFYPNPVVSSNTTYGAPFADNYDLSNLTLDFELQSKTIEATFDIGIFSLRSDKLQRVDFSPPINIVPTNPFGHFIFNRLRLEF